MKRVAFLVQMVAAVCVSGLLWGCDKPPEKFEAKDLRVEIEGAPNVKIDSAGGVGFAPVDLAVLRTAGEFKKQYETDTAALANAVSPTGTSSGGGDPTNTNAAAVSQPADPGEAGLVGIWHAVKLDPQPESQQQADDMLKKGVEFKTDHTYHILDGGKPAGDDSAGTWKIGAEGAIEMTGTQAFEFKIVGKQLTMKASATTVIMEK